LSDPLLQKLASIDSVKAADEMILTLAEEMLRAPNNQRRKNLNEIRKMVQHTIRDNLLPAVRLDQAVDELQSAWSLAIELLLPYAPQEVQDQAGELYRELFAKIKEDLAE